MFHVVLLGIQENEPSAGLPWFHRTWLARNISSGVEILLTDGKRADKTDLHEIRRCPDPSVLLDEITDLVTTKKISAVTVAYWLNILMK